MPKARIAITTNNALRATTELWKWMSEGENRQKKDWPGWNIYKRTDWDYVNCPLCTAFRKRPHGNPSNETCADCPYFKAYGICTKDGVYRAWVDNYSMENARKVYENLLAIEKGAE